MINHILINLILMHSSPLEKWYTDTAMFCYLLALFGLIIGLPILIWWLLYWKFKVSRLFKGTVGIYIGAFISIGYAFILRLIRHIEPELGSNLVRHWTFGLHILPVAISICYFTYQLYRQYYNSWLIIAGKKICPDCGKYHKEKFEHLRRRDTD